MFINRINFLPLVLLLPFISSAHAETTELQDIIVTANKVKESSDDAAQTIDVITSEQIKQRAIVNVPEALRTISGLDINTRSIPGDDIDFRMRGSDRDEVLVLLDGIPIHATDEAKANFLQLLPIDNIERIEVLKGSQSILYGSEAVGGVINIITKMGEPGKSGSVQLEGGNLSMLKETVLGSFGSDNTQLSLSFSRWDQGGRGSNERLGSNAGSFVFSHDIGDEFEIRLGGHYIRASQEISREQRFTIGVDAATSLPNLVTTYVVDDNDAQSNDQLISPFLAVKYNWKDRVSSSISYGFVHIKEKFTNSPAGAPTVQGTTGNTADFRQTSYRNYIDFLNVIKVYDNKELRIKNDFTVGFNFTGDHLGITNSGVVTFPDATIGDRSNRQNYAIYFQNNFRYQNFNLAAGMRYDNNSTFGEELSPRVSLSYKFDKTKTKLYGSYGEGFHTPDLSRFYSSQNGTDLPIRAQSEVTQSYEAGIEQKLLNEKLFLRAVYFYTDYDRLLDIAHSISDAHVWGIESDAIYKPWDKLELGLNYTYSQAKNDTDGSDLTMRPDHHLNAYIASEPINRLSLRADLGWVSSRLLPRTLSLFGIGDVTAEFRDNNNNLHDTLAGHVNLAVSARYNIPHSFKSVKNIEVFASGTNLLNDSYQESFGFTMPGWQAHGGLKVTF